MKTVMVNGKRENITYKTNTEMYTRLSADGVKTAQYGADIYSINNNDKYVVLVATAHDGSTLKRFTKVITIKVYESIIDIYDPYNNSKYHFAIMSQLGFI